MSDAIGLMPKKMALEFITTSPAFHNDSINTALWIATTALHGKTEWSGKDYDSHFLRVGMNKTMSNAKRIIGILHDVIEDTRGLGPYEWTLDDLRRAGFSERIIKGVDAVTSRPGEGYFPFVERCSLAGMDAIDVKMNDLRDNMDTSRNNGPDTEHSRKKNYAYRVSYYYLLDVKNGKIAPGSSIKDWMQGHPQWKDHMDIYEYFKDAPPPKPDVAFSKAASELPQGPEL